MYQCQSTLMSKYYDVSYQNIYFILLYSINLKNVILFTNNSVDYCFNENVYLCSEKILFSLKLMYQYHPTLMWKYYVI
jgi:hypothetical protein